MKRIALIAGLVALALPGLFASSAQAQATRTWISGVGDDVNPCSRTAPCKTFPGAIAKTAAGGEIDTLDPGGFGAVTVTKSITLANEGIGEAGILVAGTNGVTINTASTGCPTLPTPDASCMVILRGLQIDGGPSGSNSLAGVKFISGFKLIIENCTIRNFQGGSPNGYGIQFTPSASASAELDVYDTSIVNNGQTGGGATIGGGILIAPTGTPAVKVTLTNVRMYGNTNGVRIDATGATGGTIRTTMDGVVVNNSGFHGISSSAGGATTTIQTVIKNSTSNNNGADGIVSNGPNVTTWLSNDTVMGNNIGVQVGAGPSGVINSYKNNTIKGNVNDNTGVLTLLATGD